MHEVLEFVIFAVFCVLFLMLVFIHEYLNYLETLGKLKHKLRGVCITGLCILCILIIVFAYSISFNSL